LFIIKKGIVIGLDYWNY